MLIAIDLSTARRLAYGIVVGQFAVTLLAVLVSWQVADARAAASAALGGGISTVSSVVMALFAFAPGATNTAQRAIRMFFVGEAAKVAIAIALFIVVLKTVRVVPLAMLSAYIATFVVFWLALAVLLPTAGRWLPAEHLDK